MTAKRAYELGYGDGVTDRGSYHVNFDAGDLRKAYQDGWEAGAERLHEILDEADEESPE